MGAAVALFSAHSLCSSTAARPSLRLHILILVPGILMKYYCCDTRPRSGGSVGQTSCLDIDSVIQWTIISHVTDDSPMDKPYTSYITKDMLKALGLP